MQLVLIQHEKIPQHGSQVKAGQPRVSAGPSSSANGTHGTGCYGQSLQGRMGVTLGPFLKNKGHPFQKFSLPTAVFNGHARHS